MKTLQNQAWDEIAREHLGSELYTPMLLNANPKLAYQHLLLPPNLSLKIPPKPKQKQEVSPPWKS